MNQSKNINRTEAVQWTLFGTFLCAIIGLFIYNLLYGERIQFNDGLGWDGNLYAHLARQSPLELLGSRTLPDYYLGRVLPPILVHYFSKLAGIDISSNIGVIRAFYIYNFVCIVVAALILIDIGKSRGWSPLNSITVASLVLINYAVMKNMSYNPTLTDMTALTAACGLANAWSRKSVTGLVVVGFFSSFVWPSFIFIVVPLIALHQASGCDDDTERLLPVFCAALIAVGAVGGTLYAYWGGFRPMPHVNQVNEQFLWISAPTALAFLFLLFRRFADPQYFLRSISSIRVQNVIFAAILLATVKGVTHILSNGDPGPLTVSIYVPLIVLGGMVNPGLNLIAHITHFGPIVVMAMILWPHIERRVRSSGPDLMFLFGVFGFLAIGTESRQFIPFVPFIGIIIGEVLTVKRDSGSWIGFWCFTAMALAMSRFWLKINVAPWTGNFLEFPDQMLYMYTGPWMSDTMYVVFFWVCVVIGVGCFSTWQANYLWYQKRDR